MRKLVGPKLRRLFEESMEIEDSEEYIQYLKKCNESEIRETFGSDNVWELINIVFIGYEDIFDYVSEDFIKEIFINLKNDQKKYLQDDVSEMIYHVADDIYKDNKNTMKYYSKMANWLYKVGCYIKYCNPINESIKKEYTFIMDQVFYYTYVRD